MKNLLLSFAAWVARLLPPAIKRRIYGFKPLAGLVRDSLNRAVPQGLTTVKVAAGRLEGVPLVLDLQSEKDYWLGTYEMELQQAIEALIQPGWVIYDVGANIGYVSLLMARRVGEGGKVVAFEALPANLERLARNLQVSGFAGRVQVVPLAVVDSPRPVRFLIGPSGGMGKVEGSAGRSEVEYPEDITVTGTSIDHFVYHEGNPPPQAVKIDIEGGEVLALPGMQRTLAQERPIVLLELHGEQAAQIVWEFLVAAGYQICHMRPGFPVVMALEDLDWKSYVVGMPLA